MLRRLDSNARPPGYEPDELPTALLRDKLQKLPQATELFICLKLRCHTLNHCSRHIFSDINFAHGGQICRTPHNWSLMLPYQDSNLDMKFKPHLIPLQSQGNIHGVYEAMSTKRFKLLLTHKIILLFVCLAWQV